MNVCIGVGNVDDSFGGSNGSLLSSGGWCREWEVVDDRKLYSKRFFGVVFLWYVESVGGM